MVVQGRVRALRWLPPWMSATHDARAIKWSERSLTPRPDYREPSRDGASEVEG